MELMKKGVHAATVVVLFLIALILDIFTALHDSEVVPMVMYLSCSLVGIVPILAAAYDALVRKQVIVSQIIDLNCLMFSCSG